MAITPSEMTTRPHSIRRTPPRGAALELRAFDPLFAPTVASWLTDPLQLFWVAPSTEAPLTPAKIVGWVHPGDTPLLLFRAGASVPIGYVEINPVQAGADQYWIGHLVVNPAERGRGLGGAFVRLVADHAFGVIGATKLTLVVFPENRAALRCYQRCGFVVKADEQHSFAGRQGAHRMLRLELCATKLGRRPGSQARHLRERRQILPKS